MIMDATDSDFCGEKGDHVMGFFAGELEQILRDHITHPQGSPWVILKRMNVHHQQITRLKIATEQLAQVATVSEATLQQLRVELELSLLEWARLQAGMEADAFLRLLLYHSYALDDAVNTANAIFAMTLKDQLTTGAGKWHFPELSDQQPGTRIIARGSRKPIIRRRSLPRRQEEADDAEPVLPMQLPPYEAEGDENDATL
jgi:hypothetical protein